MSFWMVPANCSGRDALLLRGDDIEREDRITAPFIVIDTDIWSSGMPLKSVRMS